MDKWRPELLDAKQATHRERVAELLRTEGIEAFDTLGEQLIDLVKTKHPGRNWQPGHLEAAIEAEVEGDQATYGVWAFFPWSRRLVRLLPQAAFHLLRTDRNRHKVLREEQQVLRGKTIAVLGLSVGQSAALTLTLEAIGGRFRLADFDTLSLSNLNRLRAGVHELGVNKAVITARAMFELDPFLDIEIFQEGVQETNIDRFLTGADLLVEECDDLAIKVLVREHAKALRIPVIMDTSERGMLDVERFDLEPSRPILHGLLPNVSASQLRGLTSREKLPHVLNIIGIGNIGGEAAASMCEIDESLSTWPQLGSSVTLGGALVADTARRVLLDHFRDSGRYFVDLSALIASERKVATIPVDLTVQTVPEAKQSRRESPRLRVPAAQTGDGATSDEVRYLVANAILAPSGGNIQPWRFEWNGARLRCLLDPKRSITYLDFHNSASLLALGAAIENIVLAGEAIGLAAKVGAPSGKQAGGEAVDISVDISFGRAVPCASDLSNAIADRVTNRRLAPPQVMKIEDLAALQQAVNHADGFVKIETERQALTQLGHWLGDIDQLRFLDARMHAELLAELRWTPAEVRSTLDGVDLATLEMSASDAAIMHILAKPAAMRVLERLGGGGAMRRSAVKAMAHTSAAVLVGATGDSPTAYINAGRQFQRVWLAATTRGLAVQPWSVITFLLARYESGDEMSPRAREVLGRLSPAFRAQWQLADGPHCAMLLRLSHAPAASAISLRKDLSQSFFETQQ